MRVPAAEAVNKKTDEQPSQASLTQSIDDLNKRKVEIDAELQRYKGSTVPTEREDQLKSELVEVEAAIRNLSQAKQP